MSTQFEPGFDPLSLSLGEANGLSALQTSPGLPISRSSHTYSRVLEISHLLQTSLQPHLIVHQYANEVAKDVPLDGLFFFNKTEDLSIRVGHEARHTVEHTLTLKGRRLGLIQMLRSVPFSDLELATLEDFAAALIYPLQNAIAFNHAQRSAYQDPLTGAGNRAAMDKGLQRDLDLARRSGDPLSVLMMDLDHFKSINDRYGHQCGDTALTTVVQTARETVRGSDAIFRYGGEEFVVVLAGTDAVGAVHLAERIRSSLEALRLVCDSGGFKVTASFGVATLKSDDDPCTIVAHADKALYEAKEGGRNRVVLG